MLEPTSWCNMQWQETLGPIYVIVTSQWRANRQFMHIAAHQQQTIYYINAIHLRGWAL